MEREQINIRLTPFEKRRLQLAAEKNKMTISDFIRDAVNEKTACLDGTDIMKVRKQAA